MNLANFRVSLLGPPGCGKSTQAKLISERNGVPHLTVDSIIDFCNDSETASGARAKAFRQAHPDDPVPDRLLHWCVWYRLMQDDCVQNGWVLDGYPRTVSDVSHLVARKLVPGKVVVLQITGTDLRRMWAARGDEIPVAVVRQYAQAISEVMDALSAAAALAISIDASRAEAGVGQSIEDQLGTIGEDDDDEDDEDYYDYDGEEEVEGEEESGEEYDGEEDSGEEDEPPIVPPTPTTRPRTFAILRRVRVNGHPFLLTSRYQDPQYVGGGQYGVVVRAEDTLRHVPVAIKMIRGLMTAYEGQARVIYLTRILREVLILRHIGDRCKFVTPLIDVLPSAQREEDFNDLFIVMPWAGQNFWKVLHTFANPVMFTDEQKKRFLYQMLCGLKYIHSAGILHRDIKGGNICWDRKRNIVKLTDFGLSRGVDTAGMGAPEDATGGGQLFNRADEQMSTANLCTRWYRPPELLLQDLTASPAIDVWSLGCIFAEMLFPPSVESKMGRQVLFEGGGVRDQVRKIFTLLGTPSPDEVRGRQSLVDMAISAFPNLPRQDLASIFPSDTNVLAIGLLERMLVYNPDERISVDDALAHPYFADIRDPSQELTCTPFPFRMDRLRRKCGGNEVSAELLKKYLYRVVQSWNREKWGFTDPPKFENEVTTKSTGPFG